MEWLKYCEIKKFFNLETDQILIAHDELDLPKSEIRLKESGGHGGHNGLRISSIICKETTLSKD